ncbi:membrane hypothetical protein [Candidatus Competibacter denitrificans Run_A_D11]|uniref:TraG N-terminal Proteobacteria domain-containing protein n=1 Tax=Candidatus Competibacter denitrificans Run_A_D11 TaxID=1400863 RepID=W6M998_9GAMM|nr:conjugal transfer protein TraG N-terminal domain-containing protein [Candidatus Competibacter denitrificans]CDI02325.1 membrane hypothetical protein [Candidatus Competibacter denitrificans Run_A_D11]
MSVSGILEGYLTLYGWQVYASLFLLLVAMGGVIYPVARIVFDAALHYAEQGGDPGLGSRSLILRLAIYVLVLTLGLIPIVPIKVTTTTVQNRCGRESLATLGEKYETLKSKEYGFGEVEGANAPLLPYLAMVLASGFNSVVNKAIPCVQDLTDLSLAMNTLDFSAAEDPNTLRASVERFQKECGRRAQRVVRSFLDDENVPKGREYMEELLKKYGSTDQERQEQLVYFGSKFYLENLYRPCSGGGDPTTPAGKLCIIAPLRAQNPVNGFGYNASRDSDVSRYQAAKNQGLPTCEEWWNDGSHGLKAQLVKAGGDALQKKAMALQTGTCPGKAFLPSALCTLYSGIKTSVEDAEDTIARQMLLTNARQMTSKSIDWGWSDALIGSALFAFTDIAENLASQIAGYRVGIYLTKISANLLQPFLLMAIFMLWGLFLVIGEMRGMGLIKGLMLIFVLSILPSLWAFADYIDDRLFLTLYPDATSFSVKAIAKALVSHNATLERVMLMFTTAVFYLILPMLMLYLIAEAGGPNAGSRMAGESLLASSRQIGGLGGSAMSSTRVRLPHIKVKD